MKCADAERLIYIYRELTADERSLVDQHVRSCSGCQQIMQSINAAHETIARLKSSTPALHEAQMTSRIMHAITAKPREEASLLVNIVRALLTPSTRYGLAMFSAALVVLFLVEHGNYGNGIRLTKTYPRMPGEQVELNLAAIHQAFLKSRDNSKKITPIQACLASCTGKQGQSCKDCIEKHSVDQKR